MALHFALLVFITSCVKVITFRVVITSCVNGITSRGDYYILRQYYILRRNIRPSCLLCNTKSMIWTILWQSYSRKVYLCDSITPFSRVMPTPHHAIN